MDTSIDNNGTPGIADLASQALAAVQAGVTSYFGAHSPGSTNGVAGVQLGATATAGPTAGFSTTQLVVGGGLLAIIVAVLLKKALD